MLKPSKFSSASCPLTKTYKFFIPYDSSENPQKIHAPQAP